MNILGIFKKKEENKKNILSNKASVCEDKPKPQEILVIGLGNPGSGYANTRHNIGFMVLDEYALVRGFDFVSEKTFDVADQERSSSAVVLLKPQTFMNKSGEPMAQYLKYNPTPDQIIIVQDDMDMDLGKIRLQSDGGTAGHNGLKSLLQHWPKDTNVPMYRIKIGLVTEETRQFRKEAPDKFVLGRFTEAERDQLPKIIDRAVTKIDQIVTEGFEKATSR